MSELIISIAGSIPAIILPAATLSQLIAILRSKNADGVSIITWILSGIANICLFIYTQKYIEIQSILAFLGTGAICFTVVFFTIYYQKRKSRL